MTTQQTTRNSGGDTSQWPKARKRSEAELARLRRFYMMLPATRLLCPNGHALQRVASYANRRFTLACGCARGGKL